MYEDDKLGESREEREEADEGIRDVNQKRNQRYMQNRKSDNEEIEWQRNK